MATARKLAVLVWHALTKLKDYAWTTPALLQFKLRQLEHPSRSGGETPGPVRDYSLKMFAFKIVLGSRRPKRSNSHIPGGR